MATITSLGAGSGMDLEGLVTSLMAVEKRPLPNCRSRLLRTTRKFLPWAS